MLQIGASRAEVSGGRPRVCEDPPLYFERSNPLRTRHPRDPTSTHASRGRLIKSGVSDKCTCGALVYDMIFNKRFGAPTGPTNQSGSPAFGGLLYVHFARPAAVILILITGGLVSHLSSCGFVL